jgi:hypothetical protein
MMWGYLLFRVTVEQVSEDFSFPLPFIVPSVLNTRLPMGTGTIGPFETTEPWDSLSLHYYNCNCLLNPEAKIMLIH